MYTLYYMPGACSMAVHVILNELHQPVRLENVSVPAGQPRNPEFLKVNPRGQVPTLVDGEFVLREGGAIIPTLLDKHNSPLLPKGDKERAQALEWLMFANATLHPAYGRVFYTLKMMSDGEAKDQLLKTCIDSINKLWEDVDAQLGKTTYVCGNDISAADILLTVIANWGQTFPHPIKLGNNIKRLLKSVTARPSYQQALQLEKIEYKAAA